MVVAIQVSRNDLLYLRDTVAVRKHNPFGLSIEEYERGVYLVKGTYKDLKEFLEKCPTYPLKIKVILEGKEKSKCQEE